MLTFENKAANSGFRFIIGIDEAGRGPLAGPVVASAVCLRSVDFQNKINDSKKMSAIARAKAFHEIYENAYVGIGIVSEVVIDHVNILQATFLAMDIAVNQMVQQIPQAIPTQIKLLIDGNMFKTQLPYKYETIIEGDAKSLSIACASIIAKVTRDRLMDTYDQIYPQYGFAQHKGYPTAHHRQAIKAHGLSRIHRTSFTLS